GRAVGGGDLPHLVEIFRFVVSLATDSQFRFPVRRSAHFGRMSEFDRLMIGAMSLPLLTRLHLVPHVSHALLWCAGARLSRVSLPPCASGILWSAASAPACPQSQQIPCPSRTTRVLRSRMARVCCLDIAARPLDFSRCRRGAPHLRVAGLRVGVHPGGGVGHRVGGALVWGWQWGPGLWGGAVAWGAALGGGVAGGGDRPGGVRGWVAPGLGDGW